MEKQRLLSEVSSKGIRCEMSSFNKQKNNKTFLKIMGKGKGELVVRQRAALKRLEAAYEKFKAAGEDKKPWSSTRNGRTIYHKGKSYNEECERMKQEIANLKQNISKNHS